MAKGRQEKNENISCMNQVKAMSTTFVSCRKVECSLILLPHFEFSCPNYLPYKMRAKQTFFPKIREEKSAQHVFHPPKNKKKFVLVD